MDLVYLRLSKVLGDFYNMCSEIGCHPDMQRMYNPSEEQLDEAIRELNLYFLRQAFQEHISGLPMGMGEVLERMGLKRSYVDNEIMSDETRS